MKKNYPLFRLLNNLIDKATGFRINDETEKLLEMDTWTRDDILAYQAEKFRRLSQAASKSEFYKSFEGKPLKDYPIMDRENFKKNARALLTNIRKPYYENFTSGSTGTPVRLIVSREMLQAKRASHQKILRWNGLCRESPEFKVGGVKVSWKFGIYYFLKHKRTVYSLQISEKNAGRIIRNFNRFRPAVMYGYPSAIMQLIHFAETRNIKLHQPEIMITHAENLYPEFIRMFTNYFPDIRIANQYWTTEANIGISCPQGNIHIDEDAVFCEVINKNNKGVGDLLITNLNSFDQPIIRYKVGDRVKLSKKECPCGRKSGIIEYIDGRENDQIELPDGRKLAFTALLVSRYGDNIKNYQMFYQKQKALIDFRYIPMIPGEPIEEKKLKNYFMKDFGIELRFSRVDELEFTPSGKFRKVVAID